LSTVIAADINAVAAAFRSTFRHTINATEHTTFYPAVDAANVETFRSAFE
jgi:hypothetical protein